MYELHGIASTLPVPYACAQPYHTCTGASVQLTGIVNSIFGRCIAL